MIEEKLEGSILDVIKASLQYLYGVTDKNQEKSFSE
jgi:hypothetical protein